MVYLISAVVILLIFSNLLVLIGYRRSFMKKYDLSDNSDSCFSIVIAAKNESQRITPLLDSLELLSYPKDKLEIIIVDDESTDDTLSILRKFSAGSKFEVKIISSFVKELPAKKGALTAGIASSKFDNILITDADCQVPPNWLQSFSMIINQGYDCVIGISPFRQTGGFLNSLVCYDNFRNTFFMQSVSGFGMYFTAAARNLAFTKSAFYSAGGYKNTLDRISGDDDLLLREFNRNKKQIAINRNTASFVLTDSPGTFREYLHQKRRHVSTSHVYSFSIQVLLAFWGLTNLLPVFCLPLGFFSLVWILPFGIKFIVDYLIVRSESKQLTYHFSFFPFFLVHFINEILIPIFFITSLNDNIKWRETKQEKNK